MELEYLKLSGIVIECIYCSIFIEMDSNPLVNPYTHETPANPYPHPWNTPTCTEGKGIDGSGSGSAWEHPGVTCAHH